MAKYGQKNAKTHLILVTHAITQWNVEGRVQGHTNIPLNEQGRKMAQDLAVCLKDETIQKIYTSDLTRAVETAEPLARKKSLEIVQKIQLREGRSIHQERSNSYPTLPYHMEVENEAGVCQRMIQVLTEISEKHCGETILVISHGGAVELFITHLLENIGKPTNLYKGIRMALNLLTFDSGVFSCTNLNQVNHLKEFFDQSGYC